MPTPSNNWRAGGWSHKNSDGQQSGVWHENWNEHKWTGFGPSTTERSGAPVGMGGWIANGQPTDLYLADVPAEWSEDSIRSFQRQANLDDSSLVSVKRLLPKYGVHTRSFILNYSSHAAAAAALEAIRGRYATGRGGPTTIVARYADPPRQQQQQQQPPNPGGKPVSIGLRVRSCWSWRAGEVVAAHVGGDPGCFTVRFDNGEECVKVLDNFETEDGQPLVEALEPVCTHVGFRIRKSDTWRLGVVVGIDYSRKPGNIIVLFDEGEESLEDVRKFETEDGRPLKLPTNTNVISHSRKQTWSQHLPEDWSKDSAGGDAGIGYFERYPEKPTDLYASEVPVDWTDADLRKIHEDPSSITGIKWLPARPGSLTRPAIVHYASHAAAAAASQMLATAEVETPTGWRKLEAWYADPPKWANTRARGANEGLNRSAGSHGNDGVAEDTANARDAH